MRGLAMFIKTYARWSTIVQDSQSRTGRYQKEMTRATPCSDVAHSVHVLSFRLSNAFVHLTSIGAQDACCGTFLRQSVASRWQRLLVADFDP